MQRRNFYFLCPVILMFFMFSMPENGLTCVCSGVNIQEAFETADQVLIAKVKSFGGNVKLKSELIGDTLRLGFEKTYNGDVKPDEEMPDKIIILTVEKTYKGTHESGDEITVAEWTSDCAYFIAFPENIGTRHLLYLPKPEGDPPQYRHSKCGRSAMVEAGSRAAADILYLDKRSEVQGKRRLSGRLQSQYISGTPDFGGKKIKLQPQFSADGFKDGLELIVTQDGAFDVYDLPPGRYSIEAEIPYGWKIDANSLDKRLIEIEGNKKILLAVEAQEHIELNMEFVPDNAIKGRLLDLSGRPIKGSRITAERINGGKPGWYFGDYTNEKGEFAISGIPEGDYRLKAGWSILGTRAAPRDPIKTPYYPGVADKEQAKVFSMAPNVFFNDITMQADVEDLISVSGMTFFPDGRLLQHATITFQFSDNPKLWDDTYISPNAFGKFQFHFDIIKGTPGVLSAYISTSWFRNCPEHKQLIEAAGAEELFYSDKVQISGEEDREDIQLVFPLSYCREAAEYY